MNKDLTDHTIA